MKQVNNQRWIQPRHRIVTDILRAVIGPYAMLKYGVKVTKFQEQGNRQYLVVMNHQTPFDQFFVGMAFQGPVYYIATEDIFSIGFVSSLIRYLVAPIPIKKQTMDLKAVKTCLQVAKEGGTIALAPEGNRTYSGKTEYMNPSIAKLAKKLKLPIAIFRIEGGYGVQPRWSDVVRRGKMRAYVAKVVEPEDYEQLSNEQLFEIIRDGLYVNEACADGQFHHKKRAEYLERAIYVCPYCGLSKFESQGHLITCTSCGRKVEYASTKELKGQGFSFPFRFVSEWYEYQQSFVNGLDPEHYLQRPMFTDQANMLEVIAYHRKQPVMDNAELTLYGDRISVRDKTGQQMLFPFGEVSAVTVLGRNKANIYHDGHIYQLKGGKRFNALKYVNIFHRWTNIQEGDGNGKFLGL